MNLIRKSCAALFVALTICTAAPAQAQLGDGRVHILLGGG